LVCHSGVDPVYTLLSSYLAELKKRDIFHIVDVEASSRFFQGMLQGHKHFRCLMGVQPGLIDTEKERIIGAAVSLFLKGHGHEG
jgi:TetR/AcrR family transcriptional repressor of mexJK operon